MTSIDPHVRAGNLIRNQAIGKGTADPLPRLLAQLLARAGDNARVERAVSRPWASALFEGRRHVVRLAISGAEAQASKARLLDGIRETGSIAAAGRRMGMSYKRAWSLVQALNDGAGIPLVETSRGGTAQGGAHLTEAGREILARYRAIEQKTRAAIEPDVEAMRALAKHTSPKP